LRSEYRALFPGVYFPRGEKPTFAERAEAAWLWSHRRGVIGGCTAARLHGALWLDDALPLELFWPNARTPRDISTSAVALVDGETVTLDGMPATSLVRTAFDLARRRPLSTAVARLDALANAASFDRADVLGISASHRGVRGVRQIARVLDLHDPGAQSPKETWLRLVIVRAGFPRPRTQIPVVVDGRVKYYLDMGWEAIKLAIEYDGDHHRSDRAQFAKDVVRLEELAALGWLVVRVVAGTPPTEVIRRVRRAWDVCGSSTLR
jgi:very-short-patch-repair endonuclease